jgi:hypothetical protein
MLCLVIATILFFIAGIAPHMNRPAPPINWVAWGLFFVALSMLPFF